MPKHSRSCDSIGKLNLRWNVRKLGEQTAASAASSEPAGPIWASAHSQDAAAICGRRDAAGVARDADA